MAEAEFPEKPSAGRPRDGLFRDGALGTGRPEV
jgi:hypothetical protein